MLLADDTPTYINIHATVPNAVEAFQRLSIDERLGILWGLHRSMGDWVASSVPNSTGRAQLPGTLTHKVANLPTAEQRQVMHDLISGANNSLTRSYGCLSSNGKLAFWYQLANWMDADDSVAVPVDYQLSPHTRAVFSQIVKLEFNQKIAFLRLVVGRMGINPLVN